MGTKASQLKTKVGEVLGVGSGFESQLCHSLLPGSGTSVIRGRFKVETAHDL